MKKIRLLRIIFKRTKADKIILGHFASLLFVSFLIMKVEPGIESYGDAIWYIYTMGVTIGFGNLTTVTFIGRILSIFMSLYTLLVVGMIPAIVVSYYLEIVKRQDDETIAAFLDRVEKCPQMTKEELIQLSSEVKKKRSK